MTNNTGHKLNNTLHATTKNTKDVEEDYFLRMAVFALPSEDDRGKPPCQKLSCARYCGFGDASPSVARTTRNR